jgi:hypothetical protein
VYRTIEIRWERRKSHEKTVLTKRTDVKVRLYGPLALVNLPTSAGAALTEVGAMALFLRRRFLP